MKNSLKYLSIIAIAIGFSNYIYAGYAYITFHNLSKTNTYTITADPSSSCMDSTTGSIDLNPVDNRAFTFIYSSSNTCAFVDSYQYVDIYSNGNWLAQFEWYKAAGKAATIRYVNDHYHTIAQYDTDNKYLDMYLTDK